MNLRFLPEAENEYQEAFDYYDAIEASLADGFDHYFGDHAPKP